MKPMLSLRRLTLAALLVSAGTIALTPAANAYPGWKRWKQAPPAAWNSPGSRVVYRDRGHDGAGPALAGFIGGVLIANAFNNARPVVVHEAYCAPAPRYCPPPPCYRYEDEYSDRYWNSLDECRYAARDCRGPRVIRVIEVSSGDCVATMYWKHDHWISDEDHNWDD
jgi:hypothetical protein